MNNDLATCYNATLYAVQEQAKAQFEDRLSDEIAGAAVAGRVEDVEVEISFHVKVSRDTLGSLVKAAKKTALDTFQQLQSIPELQNLDALDTSYFDAFRKLCEEDV